MTYTNESGILSSKGEPPKILAAHENKKEVYRIHRNPIIRGTWFMSSFSLPFHMIDLRTNDLDEAKRRAEIHYKDYKAA